jgi:hypothetical protein
MPKIIDLTCYQCKKEYTLTNHRYQTKVKRGVKKFFCSNECCYAWKRTPVTENYSCLVCNIAFYRTRSQVAKSKNTFCSSSCAAKHNNKGVQRNPKKLRKCISCSAEYEFGKTKRSKLCLECSGELPTARGCGLPEIYSGTLSTSPKITTGNQLVLYSLHACNRLFQTISEKN